MVRVPGQIEDLWFAAKGTNRTEDDIPGFGPCLRKLRACPALVLIAAIVADHIFVGAHQCRGHRTCRDDKSLRNERFKHQCEDEGDRQTLDGFANDLGLLGGRLSRSVRRTRFGIAHALRFSLRTETRIPKTLIARAYLARICF